MGNGVTARECNTSILNPDLVLPDGLNLNSETSSGILMRKYQ